MSLPFLQSYSFPIHFSYFIKLGFQLLVEALSKKKWTLARDILRFMQNINRATERDSLDFGGDKPESPPLQGKLAAFPHPHPHHLPFNSSNDEFNFPLFSSQIDIGWFKGWEYEFIGKSIEIAEKLTI